MKCDKCGCETGVIISEADKHFCILCNQNRYKQEAEPLTGAAGEWKKHFDRMAYDTSSIDPNPVMDRMKVASDGLSTSYYELPAHATELRHLISHKHMSKSRGDIFKACYRLGEKDGTDTLYDLNKMKFFIDDLIEMHKRGEHL